MFKDNQMNIEELRLSCKPESIRLLFVGESPPASGDFFYNKSRMTIYTQRAYEKACGISFSDHKSFLDYFQNSGCYLDDLSTIPVDDRKSSEREEILQKSIAAFSSRLKDYRPDAIIIFLKKIEAYIKEAYNEAQLTCPIYTLPFPGNSHQNKYIDKLTEILKKHMKNRT